MRPALVRRGRAASGVVDSVSGGGGWATGGGGYGSCVRLDCGSAGEDCAIDGADSCSCADSCSAIAAADCDSSVCWGFGYDDVGCAIDGVGCDSCESCDYDDVTVKCGDRASTEIGSDCDYVELRRDEERPARQRQSFQPTEPPIDAMRTNPIEEHMKTI
jgi:hypothetical protein